MKVMCNFCPKHFSSLEGNEIFVLKKNSHVSLQDMVCEHPLEIFFSIDREKLISFIQLPDC